MSRLFTSILTDDVAGVSAFYETVFSMKRHFDSDWFVILTLGTQPALEFGVLQKTADIVPDEARTPFGGAMITFVVDNCRETFARAIECGASVVEEPRLMPYGQLRALVRDPAGSLVDISSPESA